MAVYTSHSSEYGKILYTGIWRIWKEFLFRDLNDFQNSTIMPVAILLQSFIDLKYKYEGQQFV